MQKQRKRFILNAGKEFKTTTKRFFALLRMTKNNASGVILNECEESRICLMLWSYETVKITTNEITHDKAGIEQCDIYPVSRGVLQRHCHIIESVGKAVGETAVYEERHTKEQRQRLALAGEGDNGCHNETTTYGKQTCTHRTYCQA